MKNTAVWFNSRLPPERFSCYSVSKRINNPAGVLIELKYAGDGDLGKGCADALAQIRQKNYDAALRKDGMEKIFRYGIAFYKKNCKVRSERRMLYEP